LSTDRNSRSSIARAPSVSDPVPDEKRAARIFFALWPDAELAAELHAQAVAATAQAGGRAMRLETLHLTVLFVGNVAESQLPALVAAGTEASRRIAPFDLQLDQPGFWSRQHLLWAGCRHTPAALLLLAENLRSTVTKAGFVLQPAPPKFIPHVTLVRRLPQDPGPIHWPAMPDWHCRELRLVRSQLSAAGSDYACLARWPLAGLEKTLCANI
jgi:2'-5' RNA ligase